jgi:predicted RNA binding protein YcfA (HicA-like mRNA interferase family)
MKIPRDMNAQELIKILQKYGYEKTRQTGSHIRLTKSDDKGTHHITIPNHNPIKLGTLNAIVNDICERNGIDKEQFFK